MSTMTEIPKSRVVSSVGRVPSTAASTRGGRKSSQSRLVSRATGAATKASNHMPSISEKGTVGDIDTHCQICSLRAKNRPTQFYCTTCNMPLCLYCSNQHKATKVTSEHSVVPKRDKTLNERVCTIHRFAAIQYYCDDCCKFVCVNCTMLEHRGHKVMEIGEKVKECQAVLDATLGTIDEKITSVNNELRKLQDAQTAIESSREKLKVDINQKVVALQQRIKEQQAQLLETVDTYMDTKSGFISSRREVLQNKFDTMMSVRMANELNSFDTKDEKFITDTMSIQAKIGKWKKEKVLDESELTGLKLVITNNHELGRMETTSEPLFRYKTLKSKKLPPPPNIQNQGRRSLGYSTNRSDNKLIPALDLYTGEDSPRQSSMTRREYQTVQIVHKFRTTTYVQRPSGIAILQNGRFVIADAMNHGLVICDKTGRFQQRMFVDDIAMPNGVCVDKNGYILVTTDKFVKKFKFGGTKLGQFTAYPTPGAIKSDDKGRIIVSDTKSRHVTIYDEDGRALTKFYTTDKAGNGPDPWNLSVSGENIALSYQHFGISFFVRVFNYDGELLYSAKIPEKCSGMALDRFGNMVVAAGELVYVATGGQNVLPLTTIDRSGRLYTLHANRVAFTNDGHICTLHINTAARRSEFVVLQMGRNVAAST